MRPGGTGTSCRSCPLWPRPSTSRWVATWRTARPVSATSWPPTTCWPRARPCVTAPSPRVWRADYGKGLSGLLRLLSLDRDNLRLLTALVEICDDWFLDLYNAADPRRLAEQVERFTPFAAQLARLVEDRPGDLAARAALSDFYKFRGFTAGDRARKVELYREALRFNPGNDNVRSLLKDLGEPAARKRRRRIVMNPFEVLHLDPSSSEEEIVKQAARLRQRAADEAELTAVRQAVQALDRPGRGPATARPVDAPASGPRRPDRSRSSPPPFAGPRQPPASRLLSPPLTSRNSRICCK